MFADYVSCHGQAFTDRALYLPKSWTDDRSHLDKAHVPVEASFATKPQMAVAMIEPVLAAGVPFRWVAADSVYDVGMLEAALRRRGMGVDDLAGRGATETDGPAPRLLRALGDEGIPAAPRACLDRFSWVYLNGNDEDGVSRSAPSGIRVITSTAVIDPIRDRFGLVGFLRMQRPKRQGPGRSS